MRVVEVMTADPVTVTPDTPMAEVGHLLLDGMMTALPVVDGGRLVGMVSRSDLLRHRVIRDPRAHLRPDGPDRTEPPHTVAEVMTPDPIWLPPGADEAEAATIMLQRGIRSLPVVQDGRLAGVVSATDILRAKLRGDSRVTADVDEHLREYGPPASWSVLTVDGVVTITGPEDEQARAVAEGLAETVPGVVRVHYRARGPRADSAEPPVAAGNPTDRRGLRVLDVDTCLRRLRSAPLGRIAFVRDGAPVILPVNHVVDGTTIAFRTTWGSKQLIAEGARQVAFEVDGIDAGRRCGWSVLVRGTAGRVYDEASVDRYERLPLRWWTPPPPDPVWIAIRPDEITGRET